MKICILSYEYDPFPGGGIATYHNAAARVLAEAGHEVHVVTNSARHGRTEPRYGQLRWTEGNLTVHRVESFDGRREPARNVQFLDVCPDRYAPRQRLWAAEPSNIAASRAAAYVEQLHAEVGLDVIECPEFFAEAFYILRARKSGRSGRFPPVCVHGHISSRFAFGANQHIWELGYHPHRQVMLREEYCVQEGDALLTPSFALMRRYEELFGDRLPEIRRTISYYLELPSGDGELPDALRKGGPFLVCVGRVEPRKGSDLAMKAFARLADRHRDLRLVFLGKEMWHQGESVEDVIALHVPEQHRKRVVRLGNVPREQALAAARKAAAFLHPAPWDNYPCAVLEAMGVGAACVVSDQGGHSEMVEDGVSGVVFPVGDDEALAAGVDRMLTDAAFAAEVRRQAVASARRITDPERLTAAKIEMFEAMIAAAGAASDPYSRQVTAPAAKLPPLPGRGKVLLDVGDLNRWMAGASVESLQEELESSPEWDVVALVDAGNDVELPAGIRRMTTIEDPAWLDMEADDVFVYVLAGTRFDAGRLREMVSQVRDSRVPCGSFAWLRPPDVRAFPYPSDFGWQDLLVVNRVMPPTFAVRAGHLVACRSFAGLFKAHYRLCGLMAAASATSGITMQHIGEVCGDYYRDLPIVDREIQFRAIGLLDLLGVAPRTWTDIGQLAKLPTAPVAPQPGESQTTPAVADGSDAGGAELPEDYAELKRVYGEHMALKQMPLVKLMRKVGLFDLARKLLPKAKRFIGPGAGR
ncbi:MAG: glycosyltransferase family 4 protein [Planctomycetes bacterium]|nr:glycosyltransferase family 4 protein [Planctomycetota bacterium]